jgi:hypothetical protein
MLKNTHLEAAWGSALELNQHTGEAPSSIYQAATCKAAKLMGVSREYKD